jgi:hypothetical protein
MYCLKKRTLVAKKKITIVERIIWSFNVTPLPFMKKGGKILRTLNSDITATMDTATKQTKVSLAFLCSVPMGTERKEA